MKSNSAIKRSSDKKGANIRPYSRFDHCALCDRKLGRLRLLGFANYGSNGAIAYSLCKSCKPTQHFALSELQLKMIEMRLDVDAEKVGWLNAGRAS